MKLSFYSPTLSADVEAYNLTEEMLYFTGHPAECVAIEAQTSTYHCVLGFEDGRLVTFFVLDEGPDRLEYTKTTSSILLRAFSTDSRYLRRGHARAALKALPDFVADQFPTVSEIVLAVNVANIAAQALYLDCGYRDTSARIPGPHGDLVIMKQAILREMGKEKAAHQPG